MKSKILSRTIVAFILGITLSFGLNQRIEKHRLGGREAFLAEQSQRWDLSYAHPHHLATEMIVCIPGALLFFGVYEVLVAGVFRLIRKIEA